MKLPRDCSGPDLAKALRKLGYAIVRQDGSHMRLSTTQHGEHHVTVPAHSALKVGLLNAVLKDVAAHHRMSLEDLLGELGL